VLARLRSIRSRHPHSAQKAGIVPASSPRPKLPARAGKPLMQGKLLHPHQCS